MELVLATTNPGKARELGALLPSGLRLLTLEDFPNLEPAEETHATFEGNAGAKALAAAAGAGRLALAEDSGLEVDALGGAPGVYSARYAGPEADSAKNIRRLLEELAGVPEEQRAARFRCVAVLALPGRVVAEAEGTLEGEIAFSPRGQGGFGYDPVFIPEGHGRTLAEMTLEEKNRLSHRGRALEKLRPVILSMLQARSKND